MPAPRVEFVTLNLFHYPRDRSDRDMSKSSVAVDSVGAISFLVSSAAHDPSIESAIDDCENDSRISNTRSVDPHARVARYREYSGESDSIPIAKMSHAEGSIHRYVTPSIVRSNDRARPYDHASLLPQCW